MAETIIAVWPGDRAEFRNHTAFCVGTGRLGLALQEEYQQELGAVQALCHFEHIRGHGLFCDDVGIYQPRTDADGTLREDYNFTYLDRIFDSFLRKGLRPFLELGFMPAKMASGTQTIFYWQGNTTPPADEGAWTRMVQAFLRHCVRRWGERETASWPCEVWNEPNLAGFWENADRAKYLRLYEITARAVKEVLPGMKVGGPAVCGGGVWKDWIRDFLAFCEARDVPLDFVTRHAYMGETPIHQGGYLYHTMCDPSFTLQEMRETRELIDSFDRWRGLPLHVTEFNTSYNPRCPIHDTNRNAALCAALLAGLGDSLDSYSYWTFGDVFEETGVPMRPFHGGFGLMAGGLIPKPTLWTFAFFSQLKGECVYRGEQAVILRREDGGYEGVAWNLGEDTALRVSLPTESEATLLTETVDGAGCNPLRVWHEMGEPASLTGEQLTFLRGAAQPLCASRTLAAGEAFSLPLKKDAVLRFRLLPLRRETDAGYDYDWYLTH